jgi:hypothetical protein
MIRPIEWPKSGLYWHLHHDQLIEWTDDIDERWNYVVDNKPTDELETRLRWMRPVVGPLPAELGKASVELGKARAEWDKICAERDKACVELGKARAEWDKACVECWPAIEALHTAECPGCPWDGKTLFPEATP